MTTNPKSDLTGFIVNLLKPAACLFYLAIGLEILFMISPAALYFYTLYGPALNFLDQWTGAAWLTQFFLPHISTTRSVVLNMLPMVGGTVTLVGTVVFLVAAIQIYTAKFRRRGLVTTGLYRYCRHPQYVGLALLGLGTLLLWPRFMVLIAYVLMLFLYRSLAALEERRCAAGFGDRYREYEEHTERYLPVVRPRKLFATVGMVKPSVPSRRSSLPGAIAGIMVSLALAFGLREYSLASITAHYQTQAAVLSPARLSDHELLAAYHTALNEAGIRQITSSTSETPLLIHVVPKEWHLADLPLEIGSVNGGHDTPDDFDRRRYKVLFSRVRSHEVHASGKAIVRSAYGLDPLRLVEVNIETGAITAAVSPPVHVRSGAIFQRRCFKGRNGGFTMNLIIAPKCSIPGVLILSVLVATLLNPYVSRGQEKNESPDELRLSYEAFDQHPGSGWRKITDTGKYREAARLIDRYQQETKGLVEWQRVNLQFHAGQLYAVAGDEDRALARFKAALFEQESPDAPVRWNAYVGATIAFLERDRQKLAEFREAIARGPKRQGVTPNLDVVDRLIACFHEPYSIAYREQTENCK